MNKYEEIKELRDHNESLMRINREYNQRAIKMIEDNSKLIIEIDRLKGIITKPNNTEVLKTVYQENEAVFWLRIEKVQLLQIKKKGVSVKEL